MATEGAQRHSSYMNAEALFGLMTVASMLAAYALKPGRSLFFIGFAVSWTLGSVFLFYEGAWLLGTIQGVFAILALNRWRQHIRRR
jgi:hypothetical protein